MLRSHGFHYAIVVAIVATALGALGIFSVERDYTIKTPADARWWAVVAVAAVGYGDVNPVSGEGRLIALGLMFVGIGVISVFTATMASWFVEGGAADRRQSRRRTRLASLEHQVGEVLRELRRASHELRQPSDWNPDIAAG